MQFGKFHGFAFVAFGFFLVIIQIGSFLIPRQTSARIGETSSVGRRINYLPAGIGGISMALGLALVLANWNKKQE